MIKEVLQAILICSFTGYRVMQLWPREWLEDDEY
jgi:hypothetical protein